MSNKPIKVTQSSLPTFDEYINEIRDIWESRWLTNMGVKHKSLESQLLEYLNVSNIVLFANGHFALEAIIQAMSLTGEVVTTPFTFSSTTQAIVRNNLTPIFCDINENDYTIDVNKIESLITEKTSAIIPVHVYGNVCNIEAIAKIAKKYNLKVIYDAAHVFGVKYNDKGIGSFGDASMFSFHATKVFNTIEGGAITTSDTSVIESLKAIKNFGIVSKDMIMYVGGNAKMNEFQAAMGICNLRHVESEIAKRKKVYERYMNNLDNVEGIKLSKERVNVISNYAYFPVVFENYKYSRDEVMEILEQNNIFARKYFYPITSEFECYRELFEIQPTPIAKRISEQVLTLPMYSDLELEDVDRICELIKK